jgi:crotonobetainyl-CoA:carnitine CoA-transferase CaiB-like acyl-CoA transferase
VSISGYGCSGPNVDAPVFDTILQAASGLSVLEARGEQPTALRSFIADKTTATYAVQAVTAALFARSQTGRGARIDLAMLDVMAHFNFPDLLQERTFLEEPLAPVSPPPVPAILQTMDGHVCIAPVRGGQIAATVTCVGHPEWVEVLKAITSPSAMIAELVERVGACTRTRTTKGCLKLFEDAGVPAVSVLTADEHLADAQTVHNELYGVTSSPVGPIRRVRYPARVDGAPLPWVTPATDPEDGKNPSRR